MKFQGIMIGRFRNDVYQPQLQKIVELRTNFFNIKEKIPNLPPPIIDATHLRAYHNKLSAATFGSFRNTPLPVMFTPEDGKEGGEREEEKEEEDEEEEEEQEWA